MRSNHNRKRKDQAKRNAIASTLKKEERGLNGVNDEPVLAKPRREWFASMLPFPSSSGSGSVANNHLDFSRRHSFPFHFHWCDWNTEICRATVSRKETPGKSIRKIALPAILVSALLRMGGRYLERNPVYVHGRNDRPAAMDVVTEQHESNSHATRGNNSFGAGSSTQNDDTQETTTQAKQDMSSCYVPFAYLFNKHCRQEVQVRPLFTVDQLLSVMSEWKLRVEAFDCLTLFYSIAATRKFLESATTGAFAANIFANLIYISVAPWIQGSS